MTNTRTMSGDRLIGKLEPVIDKEIFKEKPEADDDVMFFLSKTATILDNDEYEKKKEIKKQEDDEIKEDIDPQKLTDKINQGSTPSYLEVYFGGINPTFFKACVTVEVSDDSSNFVDILLSDFGCQILRGNMLLIHIKTGNFFFDNYNTNESL